MFNMAKTIFETGSIPENMRASAIVFLHKDGPEIEPSNYRTIALIEVLLKVVTAIAWRRTQAALEKAKFFVREQAGFRVSMECMEQFVAAYELCRRRRAMSLTTYCLFCDMRKAYDRVPHRPSLQKIQNAGVHGKCMNFISELYRLLQLYAKGSISRDQLVEQLRGLRQGCNGSPPDFLVFINNLLDEMRSANLGAKLPQTVEQEEGEWKGAKDAATGKKYYWNTETKETSWKKKQSDADYVDKFIGLLFADDAVVFAADHGDCQKMATMLGRWAKLNQMEFGIKKCAVLVVQPKSKLPPATTPPAAPQPITMWSPSAANQKEEVPRAATYKYLGLMFNDDLSLTEMIKWRAERVTKRTLLPMRKMLGSKHIPLNLRRQAVISLLLPALAYGGELFGLHASALTNALLHPLESVLKHALAMMASASYSIKKGTPMGTTDAILREEFGVPSVEATMAGMAVRSRIKYQASPGLISWIIKSRPPTGANTGAWPGTMESHAGKLSKWFGITAATAHWRQQPIYESSKAKESTATMGELPAHVAEAAAGGHMNAETFAATDPSTSKTEGRRMRTLINEWHFRRNFGKNTTNTTDKYAVSGYRQSARAVIQLAGLHPNLAAGFHQISKARQGSFITWKAAHKLVESPGFYGTLASTTAKDGKKNHHHQRRLPVLQKGRRGRLVRPLHLRLRQQGSEGDSQENRHQRVCHPASTGSIQTAE